MWSLRISSLVKRKEAWRRAINWLSQQDCSIGGSPCPPALRPDMLFAFGAGSHVFQRARLHQLTSPVVQASPSLASADESTPLASGATPGLETTIAEDSMNMMASNGVVVEKEMYKGFLSRLCREEEILRMAGSTQNLSELREMWAAAAVDFRPHVPIRLHSARIVNLSRLGSLTEALVAFEDMKEAMRFYGWDPEARQPEERRGVWLNHPGSPSGEKESPEASKEEQVQLTDGMVQVAGRGWDASSNLKIVYMSLVGAAVSEGNAKAFLTLSKEMKELGIEVLSNEAFYNMMICALANSLSLKKAKMLAGSMLERGITMQTNSYRLLIEAYCKTGSLKTAEALLVEALWMKAGQSTMFRSLMHACVRKDDRRRGQRVAELMMEAGLEPSQDYYAALFGLAGLANQQKPVEAVRDRVEDILFEMNRKRIKQSCASFHAMVQTLGSVGLISELMEHFRWAHGSENLLTPLLSYLVYNTAIHACLRSGKLAEFSELMQMFEKDKVKLEMSAHQALMKEESYGNAHLESAKIILDALPSIGRKPDLTTFNFLIQVVCHEDYIYAGSRLVRLMVAQGVPRDRNIYLCLLACAARRGDCSSLGKLVNEMHRDGFAGDMDTCLAAVTAHVRCERHQNAVRILRALMGRIRRTPGAVESGSEALFDQLEKWIDKDKETCTHNNVEWKAT